MENKFIEKLLEEIIDEVTPIYVENDKNKNIEQEEVNFSKEHEDAMKNMFKEMRANERRKKIIAVSKKVAGIIFGAIAISTILVGTVKAIKKNYYKFKMEKTNADYMRITFNEDDGMSGETDIKEESGDNIPFVADGIQFFYVPEGFEYKNDAIHYKMKSYYFINNSTNIFIGLKSEKIERIGKYLDDEEISGENLYFGDKIVYKMLKDDGRIGYTWFDEENSYSVYSNIESEETIFKFIDGIKILKNI